MTMTCTIPAPGSPTGYGCICTGSSTIDTTAIKAGCKNFQATDILKLDNLGITDLTPLSGLINCQGIKQLWLGSNNFTDLTPLLSLKQITWVTVIGNNPQIPASPGNCAVVKSLKSRGVEFVSDDYFKCP